MPQFTCQMFYAKSPMPCILCHRCHMPNVLCHRPDAPCPIPLVKNAMSVVPGSKPYVLCHRSTGPKPYVLYHKSKAVCPMSQVQSPMSYTTGPQVQSTVSYASDSKPCVLCQRPKLYVLYLKSGSLCPMPQVQCHRPTSPKAYVLCHRSKALCPMPQIQSLVSYATAPQWGAADAEIKVPSGENTELKRSPFKAWSRSVYSHTCYAYCQGFLPCLFLPFQSIHLHFFQNLSQFFPVLACRIK